MTRRDIRTLAWMLPLAVWLCTWWVLRGNPCLDNALQDRWDEWFAAPAARPAEPFANAGSSAIHDPHGIVACDYWPETRDHVLTAIALALITWLIGHLAARHLEQRSVRRAGLIMIAALSVAFGLVNLGFLPGLLRDAEFLGKGPAMMQVGLSVLFIALGALLAMAAAWLTHRARARG